MKPLFIPLKAEHFEAFESGTKQFEYRPWGPRWNERTLIVGRKVTLSYGYSGRRLNGYIASVGRCKAVELDEVKLKAWRGCYGARNGDVAIIGVKLEHGE